ncbi:MAG: hypothetical protein AAFV88_22735 [Planctomycetota bacterium]
MKPQHSQPISHTTEYEVDSETDAGVAQSAGPVAPPGEQATVLADSEMSSVLREVLGETMIRDQENVGQLIGALVHLRERSSAGGCDASILKQMIRVVLRHRLGESYQKLPDDLFVEVSQSLWEHESSRHRVERLWNSLGASR